MKCAAAELTIPTNVPPDTVKDAGNRALAVLMNEFANSPQLNATNSPRRFGVLPLQQDLDNGYLTMQLRNYFTEICGVKGFELYAPRSSSEWDQFLDEIKWGQQNGDTMAADTVQSFGKIQGVQGLIFGRVVSATHSKQGDLKVRVSLQAYVVETGRQLWGKEETTTEQIGQRFSLKPEYKQYVWTFAGLVGFVVLIALIVILGRIRSAARPR